jgi:hypothetical protein
VRLRSPPTANLWIGHDCDYISEQLSRSVLSRSRRTPENLVNAQEQAPQPLPPLVIPYATPAGVATSNDVWREDGVLIARNAATLPSRCVKCNASVSGNPVRKKYSWHHPAILLLLLLSPLIYVIVAIIMQKRGAIHVFVCPKHRRVRWTVITLGWLCGFGGLVVLIVGAANGSGWVAICGIVVFFAGIIAAFLSRQLYPRKIDDHFLWLKGACPEFMQELNPVPRA